jgi:hypothetical protein
VLDVQRRSGLSVRAFAHRRRLPVERVYDWRRRLGAEVVRRFLPVGESAGVEIVLRGGRTVRVRSDVDDRLLARVVAVLEGLPC